MPQHRTLRPIDASDYMEGIQTTHWPCPKCGEYVNKFTVGGHECKPKEQDDE